jgi:hypothetical protein
MLKFSAQTEDDKPAIGIGLTRDECEGLLDGRPIRFSTTNMPGLPPLEVVVMAGETEQAMTIQLIEAGVLSQENIHEDPSLASTYVRPADGKVN